MNAASLISSEQVSRIFTAYSPATIRKLARNGKVPVAGWSEGEPVFRRNSEITRAILRLTRGEGKINVR